MAQHSHKINYIFNFSAKFYLGSNEILNLSSKLLQPLNIIPQNATRTADKVPLSKSHRLMIDMGIIRPSGTGSYHLLPLGIRSLEKFRNLVKYEMARLHAQEVRLPFLVDYSLWKKSGRLDTPGLGLFKLQDRNGRECLLSPTNEESVADLIAKIPQISYSQLPLLVYQISTKFRDEIKPRCGLMKSKEFEMKDLYSFDKSLHEAEYTYKSVAEAYKNIFEAVDVPVVKVTADSKDMKGIYSHEYHIINDMGEDTIFVCNNCSYGMNSECFKGELCKQCSSDSFLKVKGIEIGHTFLLGSVYSEPLGATFRSHLNEQVPLEMACYGLGLSRFLAGALELLSSNDELTWPRLLAPFTVAIIPPKEGSKESQVGEKLARELYLRLNQIPHLCNDILLDDRGKMTIGKKLKFAKQTGYPYILVLGSKVTNDTPLIEVHDKENKVVKHIPFEEVIELFIKE